ncbi:hypothetical protein AEQ27_15185 [Frigoribacterium sp. RIT-PI-h]|nr:hypothetical protein AEQ27_15185 [Frigoribacterium sp. RIT-PI-h]
MLAEFQSFHYRAGQAGADRSLDHVVIEQRQGVLEGRRQSNAQSDAVSTHFHVALKGEMD